MSVDRITVAGILCASLGIGGVGGFLLSDFNSTETTKRGRELRARRMAGTQKADGSKERKVVTRVKIGNNDAEAERLSGRGEPQTGVGSIEAEADKKNVSIESVIAEISEFLEQDDSPRLQGVAVALRSAVARNDIRKVVRCLYALKNGKVDSAVAKTAALALKGLSGDGVAVSELIGQGRSRVVGESSVRSQGDGSIKAGEAVFEDSGFGEMQAAAEDTESYAGRDLSDVLAELQAQQVKIDAIESSLADCTTDSARIEIIKQQMAANASDRDISNMLSMNLVNVDDSVAATQAAIELASGGNEAAKDAFSYLTGKTYTPEAAKEWTASQQAK